MQCTRKIQLMIQANTTKHSKRAYQIFVNYNLNTVQAYKLDAAYILFILFCLYVITV